MAQPQILTGRPEKRGSRSRPKSNSDVPRHPRPQAVTGRPSPTSIIALFRMIPPMPLHKHHNKCPGCGYLLIGLPPEGRCPECGNAYNPSIVILWGDRGDRRGLSFQFEVISSVVWLL